MFVNRQRELAFLNAVLSQTHPTAAQFILLYGRRRVGKTSLLLHWAKQSKLPFSYWVADKEPAALQRRKLFALLLDIDLDQTPHFSSWTDCWRAVAKTLPNKKHILILDEFPYAAESDPAMLSSLQHAWDQLFKHTKITLVICGSHVHAMEMLQTRQSPLFGRLIKQWWLEALPFEALRAFLPGWPAEERVAAYALVGGIPAYLEWLNPRRPLTANIRDVLLAPGSMFLAEPQFLLYDELREPKTYLSILQAIGMGNHTLSEISNAAMVGKTHLPAYLKRLQELKFVERRLPATLPEAKMRAARQGRYHLCDAYFRFYFRFIHPYRSAFARHFEVGFARLREGLRAFIGLTAFEALSRQWVMHNKALPFEVQDVGSHWSRHVQVDVAAPNWQTRAILLGECKWGDKPVARSVLRDLVETKTPKLLRDLPDGGEGWQVHHALFGRKGFTPATKKLAEQQGVLLVDLKRLDKDLSALS